MRIAVFWPVLLCVVWSSFAEPVTPTDALAEVRALVETGKLPEAESALRLYLKEHSDSAEGHFLLGYVLFKKQDAKGSLAEYTEGAKYGKPNAGDLAVVASDYVLFHDYADADKWFTKSLEWDPNNFRTLYYLGRTKYNENRFDEAVDIFLRCLKQDPKNIKAQDNLGLSYQGLNRTDEALAAYRTAIEWQEGRETDSGPFLNLGSLLVELDRSEEALSPLQVALRLAPEEMRVRRALGKAYLHLGRLEQAQRELELAANLAPKDAPVHFMLAQLYRKRGFTDKARAETEVYRSLTGACSTDSANCYSKTPDPK